MASTDMRETTTTELTGNVDDFEVNEKALDSPADQKETEWQNSDANKWFGYYKTIPELRQAINALSMWAIGKGWTADVPTTLKLEKVKGWGEDTFQSVMENMLNVKKVVGDAYAEIIRNETGTLINIKPLNPTNMKTIVNRRGIIIRYEQIDRVSKTKPKKFQPQDILHFSNDRIGDEIHGSSVIASCENVILMRNEAMADWKRILHRSAIRVMYVDEDDKDKLKTIREQYKDAIKLGEVLILPGKKSDMELENVAVPSDQPFLNTIRYYENFFYQAVGVPKSILGGTQDFTEASSKVSVFTYDQVWQREQREIEGDLWNQLAIKVKFERPTSLKDDMVQDEAANTGQTGFQPNETQTGVTQE